MAGRKSTDRKPTEPPPSADELAAAVDAALHGNAGGGDAADTAAPAPEAGELQTQLEQATERALRLQAELENVRKRTARDIAEQRRYASLPMMRDLLPVLDNIQRAIQAAAQAANGGGLLDGFKLVDQQLKGVLAQHYCTEIKALHEPFDPHLHEAISQQPSDQHPPGTVLAVTQVGYQLHDRVVRPSQVIVSTEPPAVEPAES